MSLVEWSALALVCLLGAASPGPSLVVVLRASVHGGRRVGVLTGVSHALAVGLYAAAAVAVLAGAQAVQPGLVIALQGVGLIWLLWMMHGLLGAGEAALDVSERASLRDGFLIAFLNPKLLVFFVALFSPFVAGDMPFERKLILVVTPALIDGLWYTAAAWLFSAPRLRRKLLASARMLNRLMAALLGVMAMILAASLMEGLGVTLPFAAPTK